MSRTSETKNKILNILTNGAKTPGEISRMLNLSPSTISQHLKELSYSGMVEEFRDEHFKNIKYYKRSEVRPVLSSNRNRPMPIAILAIVVIAAAFLYTSGLGTVSAANTQPNSSVGIFLTDPPHVPAGTQQLMVSYSYIDINLTNSTGTFSDRINASGSVNLMSLVNFTKNLTSFKMPSNSVIDSIGLEISNASITINGTTYPVILPSNNVVVNVIYSNSTPGSPFDILFDMFPTVYPEIKGNQTVFVMAPSAEASTIPKKINSYYGPGQEHGGLSRMNQQEEDVLVSARAKISITNASIATSANGTSISITVSDNSNASTRLMDVLILGNDSYLLNLTLPDNGVIFHKINPNMPILHIMGLPYHNTSLGINSSNELNSSYASDSTGINESEYFTSNTQGNAGAGYGSREWGMHAGAFEVHMYMQLNQGNLSELLRNLSNSTAGSKLNLIMRDDGYENISNFINANQLHASIIGQIASAGLMARAFRQFHELDLHILSNGTLALYPTPSMLWPGHEIEYANGGYLLNSTSSVSLSYKGQITLGNGSFMLNLRPGMQYRIIVVGTRGAYASATVTAT